MAYTFDPVRARSYLSRAWDATAARDRDARANAPVDEKVRIAVDLYESTKATRPAWPNDEDRRADLAHHVHVRWGSVTVPIVGVLLLSACAGPTESEKADSVPCETSVWYVDADADGYGATEASGCEAPPGTVPEAGDCDDADPTRHPGAAELCNDLDDDCDGPSDEGLATIGAAPDDDGDGYGSSAGYVVDCAVPDGWIEDASDCDDANPEVNPDAWERCNGVDDDCDGLTDDDDDDVLDPKRWYRDADGDGFGAGDVWGYACDAGAGYSVTDDDCDDRDASVWPGAAEVCLDGTDQGCDGDADEYGGACWPFSPGPTGACGDDHAATSCPDGAAVVDAVGATWSDVQSALDAAPDGAVLTLCPGEWVGTFVVRSSVTLIGYGPGESVLSGGGVAPVMRIGDDSVGLVNLSIVDGLSTGDGTAIDVDEGVVCLDSVGFSGHGGSAPAVFVEHAGQLGVAASVFYGNTTYAAIENEGAAESIQVDGTAFVANETMAGAISTLGDGSWAITNSTFERNYSTGHSAAIVAAGAGSIQVESTRFTENTTGYDGGAIEIRLDRGGSFRCEDSTFESNGGWEGGAVVVDGAATVAFSGGRFDGNYAQDGGAIAVGRGDASTISMDGVSFADQVAVGEGGAIYISDGATTALSITGGDFTANSATSAGGLRLGGEATVVGTEVDFVGNTPDDLDGVVLGTAATFTCTGTVCE